MLIHTRLTLRVALFTRAWIEIIRVGIAPDLLLVALFTRAWIEIPKSRARKFAFAVALFTRAWIEIHIIYTITAINIASPSSRGRGLK